MEDSLAPIENLNSSERVNPSERSNKDKKKNGFSDALKEKMKEELDKKTPGKDKLILQDANDESSPEHQENENPQHEAEQEQAADDKDAEEASDSVRHVDLKA